MEMGVGLRGEWAADSVAVGKGLAGIASWEGAGTGNEVRSPPFTNSKFFTFKL